MCTANWFALSRQPSCKAILRDVAGRPLTAGSPVDKTAGRSDRTVEGVKPEMPRGAPNGETHRYSASDPQATGHPGAIREDLRVIQVTRRFGAPFPSFGGRENRRDYGRTPAPAQEQGPYRFATSEGFIAGPACAPPRRPQFEWGADCCY